MQVLENKGANAIFADKSQPSRAGDAGVPGSPVAQRAKGAGHWHQLGDRQSNRVGADVCVNYVSGADKVQEIVDHLGEHGFKAFAYRADVSKEDEVVAMFDAMREKLRTVDLVINNACLQQDAPVDQMTLAQWQKDALACNLLEQTPAHRKKLRVAIDWALDVFFSKDFVQYLHQRAFTMSRSENQPPPPSSAACDRAAATQKQP